MPNLALPDAPQRPSLDSPAFTVNVTRVEVSVLVHDSDGKPVTGLRADDFEVLEEGVAQTVRSFIPFTHPAKGLALPEPTLPPVTGASPPITIPSPASNYFAAESRVFALILDDLHVDVRRTEVARAAARRLVSQLEPSDLLLVVTTSSTDSTGFFTRDHRYATRMIDTFTGRRLLDKTMYAKRYRDNHTDNERLDHYQRLCERLQSVSLALREISGRRKTLVLLSEGSSYGAGMSDMEVRIPSARGTDRVNAGSGSLRLMNDVLAAAAVGNVAIYPLNPNGLDVPDADLIQVSGLQAPVSAGEYSDILLEARQSREMARDLATLTGGVSLMDTNDPLGGIDRVLQDASTHYVLAYEPERALKANEYRSIEIRVKRKGVRVLARRGYRAAGAPPTPPLKIPGSLTAGLRRLLSGVLPEDGLPIGVEAVPVAKTGRNTTMAVIVEIDGTRVGQRTSDGILELEQGVLTVNESGKAANGTRRLVTLRPTAGQWTVLAASSLRSVWAVDLAPGRHQLRVAALQSGSSRGGSVYLEIVVPKDPYWPTGFLVASRFLSIVPTPFIDPRLSRWTDLAPTTARVFPKGDVLSVTAPHDPEKGPAHARLVLPDGRTAWEGPSQPLEGTNAVRFVVPLDEAVNVSALVVTTSHGTQRLPVGIIAPEN
ncbi:VWA domain-containing protein [Luteitalea sp.]|uniref:VWA domain-containing protein n=1 Tax=Luteitalea sp. TaxID=2004800 RepID=UPI0025BD8DE6|nr:VWA domain-containing protein [Luteitalea sp.]